MKKKCFQVQQDGLSWLLSFAVCCCLKLVSQETLGNAGAGAWEAAAVFLSLGWVPALKFMSWGCVLRLDHVWAWRLVPDGDQRQLPWRQRRAGSPGFLLELRRPLLGWGPVAGQIESVRLLKTPGRGGDCEYSAPSTWEVVSPRLGLDRSFRRAGGRRAVGTPPQGAVHLDSRFPGGCFWCHWELELLAPDALSAGAL